MSVDDDFEEEARLDELGRTLVELGELAARELRAAGVPGWRLHGHHHYRTLLTREPRDREVDLGTGWPLLVTDHVYRGEAGLDDSTAQLFAIPDGRLVEATTPDGKLATRTAEVQRNQWNRRTGRFEGGGTAVGRSIDAGVVGGELFRRHMDGSRQSHCRIPLKLQQPQALRDHVLAVVRQLGA